MALEAVIDIDHCGIGAASTTSHPGLLVLDTPLLPNWDLITSKHGKPGEDEKEFAHGKPAPN